MCIRDRDQGRQGHTHTLNRVDAQEQDTDHRTGKLQGNDHLDTVCKMCIRDSLLIAVIICIFKIKKLYRRYDYFMRGKDAETLEDMIMKQLEDLQDLKAQDRSNKDSIRNINKNIRASFQKFGMVKYNAFKGMGGNLSFAFAMLDYTNTGFVINSVHSREGCYLYLKEVDRGQTCLLYTSRCV